MNVYTNLVLSLFGSVNTALLVFVVAMMWLMTFVVGGAVFVKGLGYACVYVSQARVARN